MTKTQELIGLAIDYSNRDFTVFVSYSGHVQSVELSVFEEGWRTKTNPTYSKTVYLNDTGTETIQLLIDKLSNLHDNYIEKLK